MRENFNDYTDSELQELKWNIENVLAMRKINKVTERMETVRDALSDLLTIAPTAYFISETNAKIPLEDLIIIIDNSTDTELDLYTSSL